MRVAARPASMVASMPTKSSTAAAPSPPVSSRMVGAVAASTPTIDSWAPSEVANASRSSAVSTATTRAGDRARRNCTAKLPSPPPAPMTTAVEPGSRRGSTRLTAWYDVAPASVRGPAMTGSTDRSGTISRTLAASTNGARPPSRPKPRPNVDEVQMLSRPRRHSWHVPHEWADTRATASPLPSPSTSSARSHTQPPTSWPRVNGTSQPSCRPNSSGTWLIMASEWHRPLAATRTSTWPGPGRGTGASANCGPCCQSRMR